MIGKKLKGFKIEIQNSPSVGELESYTLLHLCEAEVNYLTNKAANSILEDNEKHLVFDYKNNKELEDAWNYLANLHSEITGGFYNLSIRYKRQYNNKDPYSGFILIRDQKNHTIKVANSKERENSINILGLTKSQLDIFNKETVDKTHTKTLNQHNYISYDVDKYLYDRWSLLMTEKYLKNTKQK